MAKFKSFSDNTMTLSFERQPIAAYFEKYYKKDFEETAYNIIGDKIKLVVEIEE